MRVKTNQYKKPLLQNLKYSISQFFRLKKFINIIYKIIILYNTFLNFFQDINL